MKKGMTLDELAVMIGIIEEGESLEDKFPKPEPEPTGFMSFEDFVKRQEEDEECYMNECDACEDCEAPMEEVEINALDPIPYMNYWRKKYHNKLKNADVFWEMFFEELDRILNINK